MTERAPSGAITDQHIVEERNPAAMTEAFQRTGGSGISSGSPANGRESDPTPRFPSNGLRVERVYTTSGVHPYDEVSWERRDVVMTNWRDGSVNFEQRGV